ncbi:MAG: TlpA family protein disulfide reductase [Flavobacteriales bacterium]
MDRMMNCNWNRRMSRGMSRSRMLVVFALVFWGMASFGQDFKISGTIEGLPDQKGTIILEYWSEDSWKNCANAAINKEGKFLLPNKCTHAGQYRLRLSIDPKRWGDFLLIENQVVYDLKFKLEDFQMRALYTGGTKEAQGYHKIMESYANFLLNPDSLERNSRERLLMEKKFAEQLQNARVNAYPQTITADVVIPSITRPICPFIENTNIPMDSVLQWYSKHGLDNIPFKDPRVLKHFGLVRSLNYHFQYFYEKNKITEYIDQVMVKAMANEEVEAFVFRFLLDKMLDYKSEEGLSHLLTWYVSDCTDNTHVEDATRNLITALERNKPGNTIENLRLPSLPNKDIIELKQVFSKNKITILMFWRSNCSHCKEFEPELQSIYKKYKSQGIEIYAIGTDKAEEDWMASAKEKNSPWIHVFLSYDSRKDFSKRFPVPSTPTLIAVDQNGKILRRLIMRSKLEETIQEMLKEINP